jgi:hypothetical protein
MTYAKTAVTHTINRPSSCQNRNSPNGVEES